MRSRSSLPGVSLCALNVLLMVSGIWGNADPLLYRKPWPTYSLQNMPQTRFTCHDKILGGYYADAETQCQMFHVCVKVAGVGVQDFRFLCPNGTAFDQEAQICADWGDVDCEQSVLYYGSDNFDLYRLGSGFESKRAPLAEEEEATFHLQRAESGDIRRSKETRVDQKSRPEQPPNYTKHYEAATARNSFHNYAPQTQQHHHQNRKPSPKSQFADELAKKPIVNYYTPTTTTPTTTSTTTTTTTTERYNDESKQDFDEIFKGSHSSHFFSNRNGGREDDEAKSKPNDFNDYSRKSAAEQTTSAKGRSQPTRAKRIKAATTTTTTSTRSSTTPPRVTKKQPSYSTDFYDHRSSSTTARPSTTLHHTSPVHRFSFAAHDYPTQEKIQPTTYNPGNSFYHLKVTTPKYSEPASRSTAAEARPATKTTKAPKGDPRNSTFVNTNEFGEFFKLAKPQRGQTYQQQQQQQPQPFQPSPVFRAPLKTPEHDIAAEPAQQRGHSGRVSPAEPAPFRQRSSSAARDGRVAASTTKPDLKPRGFASRGSINYKATTTSAASGPSGFGESSTQGAKKFSTLVPKDQFTPTTFKPTTYKKPYDNAYSFPGQGQTSRTSAPKSVTRTSSFSSPETTTAKPFYNIDEDDGQYHPELWDVDYSNNYKTNSHRASTSAVTTTVKTTPAPTLRSFQHSFNSRTQQHQADPEPVDLSDEEELFKTAHSLNFGAASINKLRADIFKAEKTSQQYNSQYSPNAVATSLGTTTPTTTHRPPTTAARSSAVTFYTTTTTTTQRPSTSAAVSTTTQRTTYPTYEVKSSKPKATKSSSKSGGKGKKASKKASSKRPPHADEDTSYDYAYYDTDTLSESPQDYHEYEIAEFSKTRKN